MPQNEGDPQELYSTNTESLPPNDEPNTIPLLSSSLLNAQQTTPLSAPSLPDEAPTMRHSRTKSSSKRTWKALAIGLALILLFNIGLTGFLLIPKLGWFAHHSLTTHRSTFSSLPATATPINTAIPSTNAATSATITFTRTTATISASTSTLIASISGGDILATQESASVTQQSSSPIKDFYFQGAQVIFSMSVTNTSPDVTIRSFVGQQVTATDGTHTCGIVKYSDSDPSYVDIPPSSTVVQPCALPPTALPALTWNDTSHSTIPYYIKYTGSSPAGGSAPYYYVPDTCAGDHSTDAHQSAQSTLSAQLSSQTPQGSTTFWGPIFSYDDSSLSCSPAAGTKDFAIQTTKTFAVSVNASATHTTFKESDVQALQAKRLPSQIPVGFTLLSSSICPSGPSLSNTSATKTTITCPSTGVVGWNWNESAWQALANNLKSRTVDAATAMLKTTPGIVSDSVHITLTGGTILPNAANAITFTIH